MRDQLLTAIRDAGLTPPATEQVDPASEQNIKAAEKFYTETPVMAPHAMNRNGPLDPEAKYKDIAWARIMETLGIDDGLLVQARVQERDGLLAELRRHDAMAAMLVKIGVCAGVLSDEEAAKPHSTVRSLAVGVALQNIYASMMTMAQTASEAAAKLRVENTSLAKANTGLTNDLATLRNQSGGVIAGLDDLKPTVQGLEADYFYLVGDIDADNNSSSTSKIKKFGFVTIAYKDIKTLKRLRMRAVHDPENIRKFKDVATARALIEKMLENSTGHTFTRNQVISMRIARNVTESWGA